MCNSFMTKRVLCLLAVLVAAVGIWPGKGYLAMLEPPASVNQNVPVEQVNIRGNRRIPESTIKIWIGTREGDPYNPQQLDRDVRALYAQGHFDDVKVYAEEGTRGGKIITFEVRERPLLLEIKYEGLKSVQQSTVLEEFRKYVSAGQLGDAYELTTGGFRKRVSREGFAESARQYRRRWAGPALQDEGRRDLEAGQRTRGRRPGVHDHRRRSGPDDARCRPPPWGQPGHDL